MNRILMNLKHKSGVTIKIVIGDITNESCDAIINSANIYLRTGSGVCGAIYSAAGTALKGACDLYIHRLGRTLKPSEVVVTPGFNLNAKHIIHAVSPRCMFRWDETIEKCLRDTYSTIFMLAESNGFESIAIPALGVGHHYCDTNKCIAIAISELFSYISQYHRSLNEIRFIIFDESLAIKYLDNLSEFLKIHHQHNEWTATNGVNYEA